MWLPVSEHSYIRYQFCSWAVPVIGGLFITNTLHFHFLTFYNHLKLTILCETVVKTANQCLIFLRRLGMQLYKDTVWISLKQIQGHQTDEFRKHLHPHTGPWTLGLIRNYASTQSTHINALLKFIPYLSLRFFFFYIDLKRMLLDSCTQVMALLWGISELSTDRCVTWPSGTRNQTTNPLVCRGLLCQMSLCNFLLNKPNFTTLLYSLLCKPFHSYFITYH